MNGEKTLRFVKSFFCGLNHEDDLVLKSLVNDLISPYCSVFSMFALSMHALKKFQEILQIICYS